MEVMLGIIIFVFGILQIVLFFKLWGMTNDVREIKNKYLSQTTYLNQKDSEKGTDLEKHIFNIGELVIIKASEKQFRIKEIEQIDGITYYSGGYSDKYTANELANFDEYWKNKKSI